MKKYLILLLLALFSANSYSAKVYILVFKGKVVCLNTSETIPAYSRFTVLPNMSLQFEGKPVFIIYSNENKYMDYLDASSNRLSYNGILGSLKKVASANVIQLISGYHEHVDTESKTKGSVRAGAKCLSNSKLKELDQYIIPADSTRVMNDSVSLEWKFEEELSGGKLVITNATTGEKILDKSIDKTGSETLKLKNDGKYDWEIIASDENRILESNSFVKLSADESKKEQHKLEEFKKSIAGFSAETQEFLIEGYLQQNLLEN